MENLAGRLSRLSGVDDEAIQSGENLLLTFTKVRNEVGRGNDIFNQATKATLDLSVAMGKDMQSSALLVGKALNDPVKGMTALTRAGIQFTKGQKEQITALVESGDVLGAQKIILKELETQFGGSAKAAGDTTAGAFNKLKVSVENAMEAIGGALAPALASAAQGLAKFVVEIQEGEGAGGRFRVAVVGAFNTVKAVIAAAVAPVKAFVTGLRENQTWALALTGAVGGLVVAFAGLKVIAAITALMTALKVAIVGVQIAMLALRAPMVALGLLAAANPFVLIAAALVALGAALFVAYKKSETFRNIVNGVFNAVKVGVTAAINAIKSVVSAVFPTIATIFRTYFNVYKTIVTTAFSVIKTVVSTAFNVIKGIVTTGVGAIKTGFSGVKAAAGLVTGAFNAIRSVVRTVIRFAVGILDGFLGILEKVAHAAGQLPGPLGAPFRAAERAIKTARGKLQDFHTTLDATESRAAGVRAVARAFDEIQSGAGNARGAVQRLFALIDAGVIPRLRKVSELEAKAGSRRGASLPTFDVGRLFGDESNIAGLSDLLTRVEEAIGKFDPDKFNLRPLERLRDTISEKLRNLTDKKARTDALKGIRETVRGIAQAAADAFREARNKAIDSNLSAQLAAIGSGPEALELRGLLEGQESDRKGREDVDQQAALDAARANLATAQRRNNPRLIAEAQAEVDAAERAIAETARARRIEALQQSIADREAAANSEAEVARAGVDQEVATYQAGLDAQLAALVENLDKRRTSYAEFVAAVGALGLGEFTPGSDEEEALEPSRGGSVPRPRRSRRRRPPRRRRALGGPVTAGLSYLVGERGPEPFVPNVSGRIIPNGGPASMSLEISGPITINNRLDMERYLSRAAFRLSTAVRA